MPRNSSYSEIVRYGRKSFVVGTSMVRCRYKYGSLSVQVWFVVDKSMVRCRYKYGSLSVRVWFVVGTSMVRCWYKYGSLSVQVWFVVSTSMVRCRYKYGSLSVRVWFVVGTSMVKGLKMKDVKSSLKSTRVRTRLFPGATSKQLHQYVIPILIDDTPDTIIIQGGCNGISSKNIAKAIGSL